MSLDDIDLFPFQISSELEKGGRAEPVAKADGFHGNADSLHFVGEFAPIAEAHDGTVEFLTQASKEGEHLDLGSGQLQIPDDVNQAWFHVPLGALWDERGF
jgi:hypothetical protein